MIELREDQKDALRRIGIMLRRWPEYTATGNDVWYLGSRRELTDEQWEWIQNLKNTIPDNESSLLRLLVLGESV